MLPRLFLSRLFGGWFSVRWREREGVRREASEFIEEHGPEGAYIEARHQSMHAQRRDPQRSPPRRRSRSWAHLLARSICALLVLTALLGTFVRVAPKPLNDFDQPFYLLIAYDMYQHGVFSNGQFDRRDPRADPPAPGMFLGPLYPTLLWGVMKLDTRFAAAVACYAQTRNTPEKARRCEIYSRPVLIAHSLLLSAAVIAIGFAAELIFASPVIFFPACGLALFGVWSERSLLSYTMTESLSFGLFSLSTLSLIIAVSGRRGWAILLAGVMTGMLALTKPSFMLLAPLFAATLLVGGTWPWRPSQWRSAALFCSAFALVLLPWLTRNAVSVGKFGLTEEYGAAALIERFAYNGMTGREFIAAFPMCVPQVGRSLAISATGPDALTRFDWESPQGFFRIGKARRQELLDRYGSLDSVFGGIAREEMAKNWWRHAVTTIPLAWCGVWVGRSWSLCFLPLFLAGFLTGWRRSPLLLIYSAPALVMVVVHAAVGNHYTRYNLGLIGPVAVAASWFIMGAVTWSRAPRSA